jgi:Glycosyltransferase
MSDISVGLFNDSYDPIIDGVTVAVRNYAYWLNELLGPTCVVAPSAPFHEESDGFPVIRFLSIPTFVHPPYRIGLPRMDFGLCSDLRSRRFALLHAHSPFGAGRMALKIARAMRVPVVATFHSKFRDNLAQSVRVKWLVDDIVKKIVEFYYSVDRVWVPQASVALTLREYGYDGPCEVVENGIDFVPPTDIAPLRREGGRLLGEDENAIVGLFVGQHILEKNLEFLVRSLPAIVERESRFRMVFIGDGYAKARLESLASKLGLDGRVSFLGPLTDRRSLALAYARSDLLLFPSLFDNAPLAVREAAAFGTPSVLLRESTAAEVLRDGENGFLAEADPEAFAEKVLSAIEDPRALEEAGAGARRSLCRPWKDVVLEVRDRYLDILSHWAA